MRRLGRRMGWLGWVVAGVLVVSAGGAALAAQSATSTTRAPSGGGAVGKADKARAGALGPGPARHGLGRQVLHGEVTVQTQEGVKTLVMASGEVSALSKDAITVKSSDGVETSFTLNGDTATGSATSPPRAPSSRSATPPSAGEKSGSGATAKRVVSGDLAQRRPGKGATP